MRLLNKIITLLIFLSLSALISISCKSNEDPNSGTNEENGAEQRTLSYYTGDWYGSLAGNNQEYLLLTINSNGSLILKKVYTEGSNDETISSTSITRNSDTSYTFEYYDSSQGSKANITLTFSSDTQGTFAGSSSGEVPLTITKK